MSANTKRKRSNNYNSRRLPTQAQSDAQQADLERTLAQMHVQAYEAQISRGPSAWDRAQMLEAPYEPSTGNGLIALNTGQQASGWAGQDDDVFSLGAGSASTHDASVRATTAIWVDR